MSARLRRGRPAGGRRDVRRTVVRDEVQAAENYYEFKEHFDYAAKWKKVTDSFKTAIQNMESIVSDYSASEPEV